jgi:hypothetical protein
MGRLDWRAIVAIGVAALAIGVLAAVLRSPGDDDRPVSEAEVAAALRAGAGDSASTVTEVATSVPRRPAGTITATSAGPVAIGATRAAVLEQFSPPDERVAVNLGAGGPAPQENWTWHLAGGDFTVYFDNVRGRVAGFIAATPAFETPTGATVGSSFGPIQEAFSKQLRLSPIGEGNYILSPSSPGTFPALVFSVSEGTIAQILAGNPAPAGE